MIENPALIEIKLHEEDGIPVVFYKGEEITNRVKIHFEWNTDEGDEKPINIEIQRLHTNDFGAFFKETIKHDKGVVSRDSVSLIELVE